MTFFSSFQSLLQLMALLLLRHALTLTDADGDDDDTSAYFSVCQTCYTICFSSRLSFF